MMVEKKLHSIACHLEHPKEDWLCPHHISPVGTSWLPA